MILDRSHLSNAEWQFVSAVAAVTVSLVSLAALLLARLVRNSPALRHTVALSGLTGCLSTPIVAVVVIVGNGPLLTIRFPGRVPVVASLELEHSPRVARAASAPEASFASPSANTARAPFDTMRTVLPDSNVKSGSLSARGTSARQQAWRRRIDPSAAVAVVWLLGSSLLAGFTLRSVWRARRIRQRAAPASVASVDRIAEWAASRVGLRRRPSVLISAEVRTPVVVSFLNSAILLPPQALEKVSDDELCDILIHEFAHVRRRDQWILLGQTVARSLFWPIVTIHWLNRELGRAREEVCDNFVLANRDGISYAELLLRLAHAAASTAPIAATVGILNWRGELESRIGRMLDPRRDRATQSGVMARLLIVTGFLLAGTLACGTRLISAEVPSDSPSASSNTNASARPKPAVETVRPTVDSIGDPLPSAALLRLGTLRFREPAGVADLALAPDESVVVTVGGSHRRVTAWDVATGKERWRSEDLDSAYAPPAAAYGTRSIAFAGDATTFFTPGQQSNTILMWDTGSGRHEVLKIKPRQTGGSPLARVPQPEGCRSIDVTPDGRTLALGSAGGIAVCKREGEIVYELPNKAQGPFKFDQNDRLGFAGHFSLARFSPDGKVLAAVTSDRPEEIRLYDLEGHEQRKLALGARLVRLAFSANGKHLAATERDDAVRLYDVGTGKRIWSHVVKLTNIYENYTSALAFSGDGRTIAVCATDNLIHLLDAATGDDVAQLAGHNWYPWTLAFTENSQILYSSGWDGVVRRWDVAARKQLPPPVGIHATEVVTAAPDGKLLAYQDDRGTIHLGDARDGREIRTFSLPRTHFSQLLFAPDSRHLAAGGSHDDQVNVTIWDISSGRVARRWDWAKGRDPHSQVEALSFTPDGTRVAAAVFRQSAVYVWDTATGRQIGERPHSEVYGLSFSPDGKTLASAGWDSVIRFGETETGQLRREFKVAQNRNNASMYAVCYSPDGKFIAAAHMNGPIRVWQTDTMTLRKQFNVENRFVYGALNFSPDGLWLATGSMDGSVELWDPLTGSKVWNVGKHRHYVYTVGFGRDSRTLVSGGDDGVAYVWSLRPAGNVPSAESPLWQALAGEDSRAAYEAMWALTDQPERGVSLVAEKLRPVTSLIDPDRADKDNTPDEALRLKRMKRLLADRDPKIEIEVVAKRAIALLGLVGTPEAIKLLDELAKRDPNGELGRLATAARVRNSTPR